MRNKQNPHISLYRTSAYNGDSGTNAIGIYHFKDLLHIQYTHKHLSVSRSFALGCESPFSLWWLTAKVGVNLNFKNFPNLNGSRAAVEMDECDARQGK